MAVCSTMRQNRSEDVESQVGHAIRQTVSLIEWHFSGISDKGYAIAETTWYCLRHAAKLGLYAYDYFHPDTYSTTTMILYELGAYATITVPSCTVKYCLNCRTRDEQTPPHADLW